MCAEKSLALARTGVFPGGIEPDMSAEHLFEQVSKKWRIFRKAGAGHPPEELQRDPGAQQELRILRRELQSVNEELTTVNSQLQSKIAQLEATTNDLANLLSSTNIAVLFLDAEFHVRRFTPAVSDLSPDGKLRRLFASSAPVLDESGTTVAVVATSAESKST